MKAEITSGNLSQNVTRLLVAQDRHGMASDDCSGFDVIENVSHFFESFVWLRRFDDLLSHMPKCL
jgi:hypothetical protein